MSFAIMEAIRDTIAQDTQLAAWSQGNFTRDVTIDVDGDRADEPAMEDFPFVALRFQGEMFIEHGLNNNNLDSDITVASAFSVQEADDVARERLMWEFKDHLVRIINTQFNFGGAVSNSYLTEIAVADKEDLSIPAWLLTFRVEVRT